MLRTLRRRAPFRTALTHKTCNCATVETPVRKVSVEVSEHSGTRPGPKIESPERPLELPITAESHVAPGRPRQSQTQNLPRSSPPHDDKKEKEDQIQRRSPTMTVRTGGPLIPEFSFRKPVGHRLSLPRIRIRVALMVYSYFQRKRP